MKILESLPVGQDLEDIFIVKTGNGRDERRFIKGLCTVFDGRKALWWVSGELPGQGLKVFESINLEVSKKPLAGLRKPRFLIVLDRENIEGEDFHREVRKNLPGISEVEVQEFHRRGFKLSGRVGTKLVEIYVIVSGERKFLEEELAKLLGIKLPEELTDEVKEQVWAEVKRKGGIKKVLDEVEKSRLQKLIPNFIQVLKAIEDDP
jgi:hypothetical protein